MRRKPKRTSLPRILLRHWGCTLLLSASLLYLVARLLDGWDHWGFVFVEYAGPVLFFLAALCLLGAAIGRNRTVVIMGLIAMLIWWHSVRGLVGVHWPGDGDDPTGAIRVLSYNVMGFGRFGPSPIARMRILDQILKSPNDIVCLQEFVTGMGPGKYFTRQELVSHLHWHGFNAYIPKDSYPALLSRFSIINTGEVYIPHYTSSSNGIIYADLDTPQGRLRVYSVHVGTINPIREARRRLKQTRQGTMIGAEVHMARAKRDQAVFLLESLRRSPYPTVVCGDFNDPPFGFVYQKLRQRLHNAFEEKGWGIGGTLNKRPSMRLLRIDNIFVSPDIEVEGFQTLHEVEDSDHFPIRAVVRLPQRH